MLVFKILINNILDKIWENFCVRDNRDDMINIRYYYLIDRKIINNIKKKIVDLLVI